jgi:hypothetical protein
MGGYPQIKRSRSTNGCPASFVTVDGSLQLQSNILRSLQLRSKTHKKDIFSTRKMEPYPQKKSRSTMVDLLSHFETSNS